MMKQALPHIKLKRTLVEEFLKYLFFLLNKDKKSQEEIKSLTLMEIYIKYIYMVYVLKLIRCFLFLSSFEIK